MLFNRVSRELKKKKKKTECVKESLSLRLKNEGILIGELWSRMGVLTDYSRWGQSVSKEAETGNHKAW